MGKDQGFDGDLVAKQPELEANLRPYEMSLGEANQVLTDTILTPEENLTADTANTFSPHPLEKIQQALAVFSIFLLTKHKAYTIDFLHSSAFLVKFLPERRRLNLRIFKPLDQNRPTNVDLVYGSEEKLTPNVAEDILTTFVGLTPGAGNMKYVDYRPAEIIQADGYFLLGDFKVEDARNLWKGVRWMALNLLTWDQEGLALPEQLNQLKPPFKIPQALPSGE